MANDTVTPLFLKIVWFPQWAFGIEADDEFREIGQIGVQVIDHDR